MQATEVCLVMGEARAWLLEVAVVCLKAAVPVAFNSRRLWRPMMLEQALPVTNPTFNAEVARVMAEHPLEISTPIGDNKTTINLRDKTSSSNRWVILQHRRIPMPAYSSQVIGFEDQ